MKGACAAMSVILVGMPQKYEMCIGDDCMYDGYEDGSLVMQTPLGRSLFLSPPGASDPQQPWCVA